VICGGPRSVISGGGQSRASLPMKRTRAPTELTPDEVREIIAALHPSTREIISRSNERWAAKVMKFRKELVKLTPVLREMLILHEASGFTVEEVAAICGVPRSTAKRRVYRARACFNQLISDLATIAALSVTSVIIPERPVAEGLLINSTSAIWAEIVRSLGSDWTLANEIPWEKWEEIIAGAFKRAQYDEVILTPRSWAGCDRDQARCGMCEDPGICEGLQAWAFGSLR
jgi:Sigma-70, region 4